MAENSVQGVTQPDRFLFIDGLRGIASMMVVFYHIRMVMIDAIADWFPAWLDFLFKHGNLGVDMFFVLSGFVIAHSIRDGDYTIRYLSKFALRRSIRLDPPLWTTILLEIILFQVSRYFYPDLGLSIPTFKQVLANIAYLQEILGVRNVVDAFWSLTYEVQFYFVSVAFLVISSLISRWDARIPFGRIVTYFMATIAYVYSIAIYHKLAPIPLRGIFLERWFQFFLGVITWAVVRKTLRFRWYAVAWTFCLASTLLAAPSGYRVESSLGALIVSAVILWVGYTGRMSKLLCDSISQFLGRISYSLYLLHLPIGWRFAALFKRLAGPDLSVATGISVYLGSIMVSIFASWIMYLMIEAPSMRFARKVKLPRRSP